MGRLGNTVPDGGLTHDTFDRVSCHGRPYDMPCAHEHACARSPDGELIASGGHDGVLHWWHGDDDPAGNVDVRSSIRHLAITEDGVVFVATDDHLLALRL